MKTWKLLSGLFTLMSSFFVGFSGLVLGLDQAFKHKADNGESDGIFIAFFMFFGGLVSIFLRKSKVSGNIAIIILHTIVAIIGFQSEATKWHAVGAWALLCAGVATYSFYKNYKDAKQETKQSNNQTFHNASNSQCPYCHTDVPRGSAFCGSCGKELSKQSFCSYCGNSVDVNAQFCSNCGKHLTTDSAEIADNAVENVSSIEEFVNEEEKPIKRYLLYALVVIALITICGGGWWYSKSSNSSQKSVDTDTLVSVDVNSKEYIKNYLDDILPKAIKMEEQQAIKKYFTKDFADLYRKVEVCDSVVNADGNIGFWNFEFWTGGQDGELASINVLDVSDLSQNKATALVQYVIKFGNYDESKSSQNLYLVHEDGNWLIDDFNSYKDRFKDYLKSSKQSNNSNSYVGKTYKGSGNGGGLYTEMTITFIDGNKCRCTSDWYQAYPEGKTLNGTYEVKSDHVVVHCAYDGVDYNFNFEVHDNGRVLGFDNSDNSMEGTIGNDFMTLELSD